MSSGHDASHDAPGHDGHGGDKPYEKPMNFSIVAAVLVTATALGVTFLMRPAHEHEHAAEVSESKPWPAPVVGPADLILKNAVVVAPGREPATTIVIGNGKIVAVGSGELLDRKTSSTKVRDMGGATIVPGLRDAHGHLLELGQKLNGRSCDLEGSTSVGDVVLRLQTWMKINQPKPGDWLVGSGWDESLFMEEAPLPVALLQKLKAAHDRGDKVEEEKIENEIKNSSPEVQGHLPDSTAPLDELAPENPVLLYRVDGHCAWVNKKALEIAKIAHDSFDPPEGRILRDAQGEPSGILIDSAIDLVASHEPPEKLDDMKADILAALNACARAGLVEVHDAGLGDAAENAIRYLARERKLPIRVYAMIGRSGADLKERLTHQPALEQMDNGMLTIRAVKLYADGALGSRGALLLAPYSDKPDTKGIRRMSPEEMEKIATMCAERGFQVCVHAIGDAANRTVLDVYERVLSKKGGKDARFRIEHAQVIAPEDLPRFAKLGVIASMQPKHATTDMRWAEARVGSERLKGAYAWRTLLRSGAHLAFGSDFPVEPPAPLRGLYAAVTRQDEKGSPKGGWRSEERLTPDEALRAFTEGAAYAAFEENERGELAPGKDADLTVLSGDPLDLLLSPEPQRALQVKVLGVYVAGQEVGPAK